MAQVPRPPVTTGTASSPLDKQAKIDKRFRERFRLDVDPAAPEVGYDRSATDTPSPANSDRATNVQDSNASTSPRFPTGTSPRFEAGVGSPVIKKPSKPPKLNGGRPAPSGTPQPAFPVTDRRGAPDE